MLLDALKAAVESTTPQGPVASAEAQLTPSDLSAGEAGDLLREAVGEIRDRLTILERTVYPADPPRGPEEELVMEGARLGISSVLANTPYVTDWRIVAFHGDFAQNRQTVVLQVVGNNGKNVTLQIPLRHPPGAMAAEVFSALHNLRDELSNGV